VKTITHEGKPVIRRLMDSEALDWAAKNLRLKTDVATPRITFRKGVPATDLFRELLRAHEYADAGVPFADSFPGAPATPFWTAIDWYDPPPAGLYWVAAKDPELLAIAKITVSGGVFFEMYCSDSMSWAIIPEYYAPFVPPAMPGEGEH